MTDHIKIKCDDCKFVEECVDYGWDECKKFTPKPSEPMTNEEWLRSATTEQLAEWLQEHMDCSNCDCNKDLCYKGYDCCKLAFLEWLKQSHT